MREESGKDLCPPQHIHTYPTWGGGRGREEAPKKIRRYANVAYYENAQWINLTAPSKGCKVVFLHRIQGPDSYKTKGDNKAIAHSLGHPET